MIIVKLQGGLGNQMFQYAIGKQLSLLHKTRLKLDLSFLQDRTPRKHFTFRDFELESFDINCEYTTAKETKIFNNNSLINRIKRRLSQTKFIYEKNHNFQKNIFQSGDQIYLDGYWQSEKYFNRIRDILMNDFTLKKTISDKMNSKDPLNILVQSIKNSNSVSVHFRRGDYISDEVVNSFHGTCSNQYYLNAIDLIAQKVRSPHFYLFSDDPEWISSNPIFNGFPYTIAATSDMHIDMHLMSLCQHNIIANSSFSWWGAWLNRHSEKMVIAPERWFANDIMNQQTRDLIPQNWIRI